MPTKGKGGKVYTSYLLRRSYREGGKVRHENLGNLSHLPIEVIEAIRKMLEGRVLVDLEEQLEIESSLPHGHVAAVLSVLRGLDLERLISRERRRERDLAVAMLCQLVIAPASKLSMTRRFSQTTLADELSLGEVKEVELLATMDWLLERQERIETTLARRHLQAGGFVLYDLSSSYFEGRCCPLAALGHNRDGKSGKLQVNWGLVCSPDGRPVSVQVHPGNTADPSTVPDMIDTIKERFGIERVILVGDRAMITDAHATTLKELGTGFVSALKTAQIRKLIGSGELQLTLFDQTNLAEISSEEFPGERLVVCRNPHLAAERAQTRGPIASDRARARQGQADGRPTSRHAASRRRREDRRACRPRDQQVQGRQALRAPDRRPLVQLPAQDRRDRRGGRARRALRTQNHLPHRPAHHPSSGPRLQTTQAGRARLPHDSGRPRRPPDPPPPPRPRRGALLPVPARLPPAVRAPSPPRADAVHRRHAAHPSRPRRTRATLPRRQHRSRPRPHPGCGRGPALVLAATSRGCNRGGWGERRVVCEQHRREAGLEFEQEVVGEQEQKCASTRSWRWWRIGRTSRASLMVRMARSASLSCL